MQVKGLSHARLGVSLVVLLLLAAGSAAWAAVRLHDSGLDPHWRAVGTAGLFAGLFCCAALFKLIRAMLDRQGWAGASLWLALGFVSLFALLAVAEATRLGG